MNIRIKRVYEKYSIDDGELILVDRLWPRGISKQKAQWHYWWKEIAPSTELRKWFNHDPEKWSEFKSKYEAELEKNKKEIMKLLAKLDLRQRITLLYAAKDENHNEALVLLNFIENLK